MSGSAPKLVLSIKPEFASLIFSGDKRFEYRKTRPNRWFDGIYIHICGENPQCVQGYAACTGQIIGKPNVLWKDTRWGAGMTETQFSDYFKGAKEGYAFKLAGATRFTEPISLSSLGLARAPQSYAYVKEGSLQPCFRSGSNCTKSEVVVGG